MGNQITKHPDELLTVSMDFTNRLSPYTSISSASVTKVSGDATITPGVLNGNVFPFSVAAGTDGTATLVKVVGNASNGEILVGLLTTKVSVLQ